MHDLQKSPSSFLWNRMTSAPMFWRNVTCLVGAWQPHNWQFIVFLSFRVSAGRSRCGCLPGELPARGADVNREADKKPPLEISRLRGKRGANVWNDHQAKNPRIHLRDRPPRRMRRARAATN